jgi:hypothetical protein
MTPSRRSSMSISPRSSSPFDIESHEYDSRPDRCSNDISSATSFDPSDPERSPLLSTKSSFSSQQSFSYSYPRLAQQSVSLHTKILATLRPRRRLSTLAIIKRRIIHILLALSIPILGLLLISEIHIHRLRSTSTHVTNILPSTSFNLQTLRIQYEKKRRREIQLERPSTGLLSRLSRKSADERLSWDVDVGRRVKEEVLDVWPVWWGQKDLVGVSPWDHIPEPMIGNRRRVLFLTGEFASLNITKLRIRGLSGEDEYTYIRDCRRYVLIVHCYGSTNLSISCATSSPYTSRRLGPRLGWVQCVPTDICKRQSACLSYSSA